MGLLQDKVCVITGGAGSIGLASARKFLDEGGRVMLVDLHEKDLLRVSAELPRERVAIRAADVGVAADARAYIAATVERFGKIDVLFSNAGNAGVVAPLADYPEDVFDEVWRVHVKGAFLACKYGLAQMNDGGSVIITSSVAGLRGDPGVCAYITAKHAQIGLMRSAAKEAAPRRIRVNTIHPGPDAKRVPGRARTHVERRTGTGRAHVFRRTHSPEATCGAGGDRSGRGVSCERTEQLHDWRHAGRGRRHERMTRALNGVWIE